MISIKSILKSVHVHLGINTIVTIAATIIIVLGISWLWNMKYSWKPQFVQAIRDNCMKVVIQNGQSSEFEITGYGMGAPYNSITRSGNALINAGFVRIGSIEMFTVAVDPDVISLGSILWIESLGIGVASDTGPAVTGMHIDVCFQSMDEAMKWGKQKKSVTVLERK